VEASSTRQVGGGARGLEVDILSGSGQCDAVPGTDGLAEEVAVCGLCGLVSRLPLPVVCPACGGGYG